MASPPPPPQPLAPLYENGEVEDENPLIDRFKKTWKQEIRRLRLASQWCIRPNIPASSSPLGCFQTIWQRDKDESIIELNSGLMEELISKRLASCNGNEGVDVCWRRKQ